MSQKKDGMRTESAHSSGERTKCSHSHLILSSPSPAANGHEKESILCFVAVVLIEYWASIWSCRLTELFRIQIPLAN